MQFTEHRMEDRRVVRMIQAWLTAGALKDGTQAWNEDGTPQEGSILPLPANVYLYDVDCLVDVLRQYPCRIRWGLYRG